jgi:hypothetical protein
MEVEARDESGDKHPDELVSVTVNKKAVEVPHKTTGAAIKAAAGVPLSFKLYRKEGAHLDPVGDNDELTVHEDEAFVAVSGQDVS